MSHWTLGKNKGKRKIKDFNRVVAIIYKNLRITVESNHAFVIAKLSDWLKKLAPVFQPMRSKTKISRILNAQFLPRFVQVTGNCHEF